MDTYMLIAQNENFIKRYAVKATSLVEASKKARILFGKDFNSIGRQVIIKLNPTDLSNHIDEILEKFVEV